MRGNRPHRVDQNQPDIVKSLRSIPGVSVFETHMVGRGFPDLACGYRGKTSLIELKVKGASLTLPEQGFQLYWTGDVSVCYCLDDVLKAIGVKR
jgi:hypothetical protein